MITRETYELHFSIKHRNTLKVPQKVRDSPEAFPDFDSVAHNIKGAKQNLGYIARDAARADPADLIFAHAGKIKDGAEVEPGQLKKRMSQAIDERAKKHRKNVGVRLSDTMIVSLPNDATDEECREIAWGMLSHLVGDSEAHAMAAIHSDKERNKHLHIFYVDGLETRESAKARNPEAKRVRRRDFGRQIVQEMPVGTDGNQLKNECGKPITAHGKLRADFAKIINDVGDREGRRFAEHRTFKERGIERTPQTHEGQEVQDKLARGDELTDASKDRVERNQEIIAANIVAEGGNENQQLRRVPKRWRLPQFFDSWRSKLSGLMSREKVQDEAQKTPAKSGGFFRGGGIKIPTFEEDNEKSVQPIGALGVQEERAREGLLRV